MHLTIKAFLTQAGGGLDGGGCAGMVDRAGPSGSRLVARNALIRGHGSIRAGTLLAT